MSEFTEIILRLLWRFYPIAWLTTAIVRGLSTITSWLEDEGYRCLLAGDREECVWIGGWLGLAEERLNELIVMKAMKLLKRSYYPPPPCGHHPARAVRTPEEILARLARLCALYHDHKRLYELRAQKLARLFQAAELQLEVIHHPVETQPASACGGGDVSVVVGGGGDDGGACAATTAHPAQPIRGPPWPGLKSANLSPSQPARPSRENERPCVKRHQSRSEGRTLLPISYSQLPRERSLRYPSFAAFANRSSAAVAAANASRLGC